MKIPLYESISDLMWKRVAETCLDNDDKSPAKQELRELIDAQVERLCPLTAASFNYLRTASQGGGMRTTRSPTLGLSRRWSG